MMIIIIVDWCDEFDVLFWCDEEDIIIFGWKDVLVCMCDGKQKGTNNLNGFLLSLNALGLMK